jgi:hypothetical protein
MEDETCPYCGEGPITRERRPDGYTSCGSCGTKKLHAAWNLDADKPLTPDEFRDGDPAKLVSISSERLSETADFRDDFAVALGDTLHPDVYERLEALSELYGEIGYRAVLSMLITESYMDRVAAFRDAEEG